MISGRGRTLSYIADAVGKGELGHARITGVVCSTPPGSEGFELAGRVVGEQVPVVYLEGHPSAAALEQTVMSMGGADYVVLAGYLKRLEVPTSLRGRIVNIHPALLPAFGGKGMYGRRVHEAVLASGVTESGCTVHLVDAEYDNGPVLIQRRCEVRPSDTPETLAARVFEQEKGAYIEALGQLLGLSGRVGKEVAR